VLFHDDPICLGSEHFLQDLTLPNGGRDAVVVFCLCSPMPLAAVSVVTSSTPSATWNFTPYKCQTVLFIVSFTCIASLAAVLLYCE
jgi:hypothetical protein